MNTRIALAAGIGIGMLVAWVPGPMRPIDLIAGQGPQHEQHHPATAQTTGGAAPNAMMDNMMAADARLDELVKKMNEAKGQAKTDAIAEVVTALVEQHRAMRGMMAGRMGMMNQMMNRPEAPAPAPAQPEKK